MKLEKRCERLVATCANMSGSEFHDVNLSGLRLKKVNLAGASITDANIDGLRIDGVEISKLLDTYKDCVEEAN